MKSRFFPTPIIMWYRVEEKQDLAFPYPNMFTGVETKQDLAFSLPLYVLYRGREKNNISLFPYP